MRGGSGASPKGGGGGEGALDRACGCCAQKGVFPPLDGALTLAWVVVWMLLRGLAMERGSAPGPALVVVWRGLELMELEYCSFSSDIRASDSCGREMASWAWAWPWALLWVW